MSAKAAAATTTTKPFFPKEVRRATYVAPGGFSPKTTGSLRLEDTDGGTVCWKMGTETADQLVEHRRLAGANDGLFYSSKIKVFFPIVSSSPGYDAYFATKTLKINGKPTLLRVLKAVETTARHAVASHLLVDLQRKSVTLEDVNAHLQQQKAIVCHLLLRRAGGGNHVYVRLTDI